MPNLVFAIPPFRGDIQKTLSWFTSFSIAKAEAVDVAVAGVVALAVTGVWAGAAAGNDMSTNVLLTLTAGLGTSFGIGCIIGLLNPYVLLAIALTGLPLATMLLYPLLKRRKLVAKYRQSESRLIKP